VNLFPKRDIENKLSKYLILSLLLSWIIFLIPEKFWLNEGALLKLKSPYNKTTSDDRLLT
jgi:hypothetical protein